MNRYIQQFINENESLIDDDDWDTIYSKLWSLYGYSTIGEFTQLLTQAGIFPIKKLSVIPEGFRYNDLTLTVETIPDNVTKISEHAYAWCTRLHTLIFNTTKCTEIGENAFQFCANLTSVKIPACVRSIRSGAFSACSKLSTLEFEEGIQSIEKQAFIGTNIQEVVLPRSLIMLGMSVFPPTCTMKIYTGSDIEQVVRSHKYKVEYIN
jgi:hypothetical protein